MRETFQKLSTIEEKTKTNEIHLYHLLKFDAGFRKQFSKQQTTYIEEASY